MGEQRPLPAAPDEALPDRLGRYRVLDLVAGGSFAIVYRGHDDELGRDVAIKVLRRRLVESPRVLRAFRNEARILASLEHPHILPVYDVGQTPDGSAFLVSKFVEGEDLQTRLRRGPVSLEEAVDVTAALAEALDCAHARGLVHRDVKPANVLLTPDGRPLLADFGLALSREEFGTGPAVVGTPLYMSPEQARRQADRVDARSDVYSLGVVFYELLTGRPPFPGGNAAELEAFICTGEAVPPRQLVPSVPPELEAVWRRATAREPADRYPTAGDFAADLRRWSAGRTRVLLPALDDTARGEVERRELAALQDLLWRRLVQACLVLAVPSALLLALLLAVPALGARVDPWDWLAFVAIPVFFSLPLPLLLGRRRPSLARLRHIELALFGTSALLLAIGQAAWFRSGWLSGVARPGAEDRFMAVAGESWLLPWFILIVVYGASIPNTGRRCAAVVGGLAVLPLVLTAWLGLTVPGPGEFVWSAFLPKLALWLSVAAGVAVYGCYKLDTLRRAAATGERLGQYRLTRRLGGGDTGEVWLADHELHCRPCVVKVVAAATAGPRLADFERTARRVAGLTHWNTAGLFDFGHTASGAFYTVMEFIPGLSLQWLGERYQPLPPARVVHWLRQACWSLREAHAQGLVHGNLNPGNVLVCERGGLHDVVKLIDFGFPPSAPYGAPEQATGAADERSDVFGLGAVAYFLLSGRPPAAGAPPLEEVRPELPPELADVVHCCLAPAPEDRYPSIEGVSRALGSCPDLGAWTPAQAAAWWRDHGQEARARPRAD